jgi:hypothetical protein
MQGRGRSSVPHRARALIYLGLPTQEIAIRLITIAIRLITITIRLITIAIRLITIAIRLITIAIRLIYLGLPTQDPKLLLS